MRVFLLMFAFITMWLDQVYQYPQLVVLLPLAEVEFVAGITPGIVQFELVDGEVHDLHLFVEAR